MIRAEAIIHGRVQGVFFRKFVRDHALQLNIKGYAKNIGFNKVKVVAQGEKNRVQQLIQICEEGPSASNVERVDVVFDKPTDEYTNFQVKY